MWRWWQRKLWDKRTQELAESVEVLRGQLLREGDRSRGLEDQLSELQTRRSFLGHALSCTSVIRDPLHGNIPLPLYLKRTISHPAFARLQRLFQLGPVRMVFPGATHHRFLHSLGSYHLTHRALAMLGVRRLEEIGFTDEDVRIVLAVALLHDIGHYPHAHLLEESVAPNPELAFPHHEDPARLETLLNSEIDGAPPLRSILASDWQLNDEAIKTVLWLIGWPKSVADPPQVAGGPPRKYRFFLKSLLEPERIDYLLRDALFTGVSYGQVIDLDRYLQSLDVDGDAGIICTTKGNAVLEAVQLAKYLMYRHIYWHQSVQGMQQMWRRMIHEYLCSPTRDWPKEQFIESYVACTDEDVEEFLAKKRKGFNHRYLDALRRREIYRRVCDVPVMDLGADQGMIFQRIDENLVKQPRAWLALENEMAERFDLAPGDLLIDLPLWKARFDIPQTDIRDKGSVRGLMLQDSPILFHLQESQSEAAIRRLRILVDRRVAAAPRDAMTNYDELLRRRDDLIRMVLDRAGV